MPMYSHFFVYYTKLILRERCDIYFLINLVINTSHTKFEFKYIFMYVHFIFSHRSSHTKSEFKYMYMHVHFLKIV